MTRPSLSHRDVRRPDVRDRLARDLARFGRRETGGRSFWRSLGVIGTVGWPIVVLSVGGAYLGRWIDATWQTGVRVTAILLVLGAGAGAAIAWHVVHPNRR